MRPALMPLVALVAAGSVATTAYAAPETVLAFGTGLASAASPCASATARDARRFVMESEFTKVVGLPTALQICTTDGGKAIRVPGMVVGLYRPVGVSQRAQAADAAQAAGGGHYTMVVLSNPTAGQDRAYQRWYDTNHLPSVLRNPGFVEARRYRLVRTIANDGRKLPRYAAIYTLVSANLQATEDEVVRRLRSGETPMSPAFDYPSSVTRYYRDCPSSGACPP